MELTKKTYTIDDIYKLSAGERAELIDEHLYPINPPNQKYQEVLNYLSAEIKLYIESKNLDCEIYIAPFPVILKLMEKPMWNQILVLFVINLN